MNCRIFIKLILFQFLLGCDLPKTKKESKQFAKDSSRVMQFVREGNKIYATHSGLKAFEQSMLYYDSAWQIAQKTKDTFLLGISIWAKGRAYDAWNNEPQMTIQCFEQAAKLYKNLPDRYESYLYINELIAHAYEKIGDSANALNSLQFLYGELIDKSDSIKQKMKFIPQMATVSTDVKNYSFAEKILKNLCRREWIRNDSDSYNYLDNYYLTMARIEIYRDKKNNSLYIDSFERAYLNCTKLGDTTYYLSQLIELHGALGKLEKKHFFEQQYQEVQSRYNSPTGISSFQKSLNEIEKANMLRQMTIEQDRIYAQKVFSGILICLLLIITSLGVFLYRRNKEVVLKQQQLASINKELNHKNLQNQVLNKELNHRVKNNLQMILSLIHMQERNTETQDAKKNLHEIRLRIESIASLHRHLIDQNDNWVDIKKYVSQMLDSIISLMDDTNQVIAHFEIENLNLPTNISLPLGLTLNELFTNSIKYARPQNGILELFLQIQKRNDGIFISYHDSGKAIDESEVKSSLGLNIIQLLCRQMNTVIEQSPDNFFDYTIHIPYES